MGKTQGKLEELKGDVEVKGVQSGSVKFFLVYNQITSSYAIRFQYLCKDSGSFDLVVYYKGQEIKCIDNKKTIKVKPLEFSLKNSKFSIILDKTIKMESNTQVTINNANQFPRFTLEFYTESGEKTTYSSDDKFSLVITSGSTSVKFTEVRNNNYIDFNFDHSFEQIYKTLSGECTLTLTGGSQSLSWKIRLLGDGNEYSDEKNFDISNEIEKGIKFIKECLTNNKNILIHCKYGISRNTTCAIAFMIKEMNYSALNALEFIRNKRKIAMPNSSFLKQLINYEKQIKNNNNNEENKSI